MVDPHPRDNPKQFNEHEIVDLITALRGLKQELTRVLRDRRPRPRPLAREWALQGDLDGDTSSADCYGQERAQGHGHAGDPSRRDHQEGPCRTQLIVNGVLTLPREKPDIETVLRFHPKCRVTNWQSVQTADGRKIVVTGIMEIGVEYVSTAPDQPLHFAHFIVPFHTFFLCAEPINDVVCDVQFKHNELVDPRNISQVVLVGTRGVR